MIGICVVIGIVIGFVISHLIDYFEYKKQKTIINHEIMNKQIQKLDKEIKDNKCTNDTIIGYLQNYIKIIWKSQDHNANMKYHLGCIKHIIDDYPNIFNDIYIISPYNDKYVDNQLKFEDGKKQTWKYPIVCSGNVINYYLPTDIDISKVSYTKDNKPKFLHRDDGIFNFWNDRYEPQIDENNINDQTAKDISLYYIYNIPDHKIVDMRLVNKCLEFNHLFG